MIDEQYINRLFQKYQDNSCTQQEENELWTLFENPIYKDYFNGLIMKQMSVEHQPDSSIKPVLDKVLSKLNIVPPAEKNSRRLKINPYLSIAASLILLSCGGLLFYKYHQIANKKPLTSQYGEDMPAGGDKAKLTLSDGTVVLLDQIEKGVIHTEKGITVSKGENGQLIYKVADKLSLHKQEQAFMNSVSTPNGGQYQIILPDGSKVWLNASSKLTFPASFTGSERKVRLSGEAYFEINHNRRLTPFIVETQTQNINVLGTSFDVKSYIEDSISTTSLLSGSVVVTSKNESRLLKPGEQTLTSNGRMFIKKADTAAVMDWKNGDFVFSDESLESIMRRVARWYDVEVKYHATYSPHTFGGKISRKKNLSAVLRLLELSGGVKFKLQDKILYVN